MRKKRVNDEYIYCYKCGTKNSSKDKKCCNKECQTKLHGKDHLYWYYLVEKWHEFLEDLGKDSVVGALTLFFNYILYGTVLSISVITIVSGFVDTIIDKMNNEEPEKIVDYTNKYDDSSLIKGCWYSEVHDDYWVIGNEQYRLKDKKRAKLNYNFTKIDDKKVLTIIFNDIITTGEYKWDGADNFTFYFDNFEAARAEYKRIQCSDVPGERGEDPIVEQPPSIVAPKSTSRNISEKRTSMRTTKSSTITQKKTIATTTQKSYLYRSTFSSLESCKVKLSEVTKDYCSKQFPGVTDNPKFLDFDLSVIVPSDCKEVTSDSNNKEYLLEIDRIDDCEPVYIN